MSGALGSGYLAQVEASFVGVRSAPGAVFLRLGRDFASEGQRTGMFTEMTPGQALSVIRELEAAVKQALAHIA
jgi:hypothetical protein